MQREQFRRFLSCLMCYSWRLHHDDKSTRDKSSCKKKKHRNFPDVLRHTWKISRDELSGRILPLATSGWKF